MNLHEKNTEVEDFMSNVCNIIQKYKLDVPNRKRNLIYKRYYLFDQLHKAKLSLNQIGDLFNKDHSTVIHGLRVHDMFTRMKDKLYLDSTDVIKRELLFLPEQRDLISDIMECNDLEELKRIKNDIIRKIY